MAIIVRKKEGEPGNSLLYSFTRRVKRSGILREKRALMDRQRKLGLA
jgi:hypothetical protein